MDEMEFWDHWLVDIAASLDHGKRRDTNISSLNEQLQLHFIGLLLLFAGLVI